jgi:DNA modification methylase
MDDEGKPSLPRKLLMVLTYLSSFLFAKRIYMNDYDEFLKNKTSINVATGLVDIPPLNPMLYDFQADLVRWALRRGRAALFCDCGLGKTPMQLEWSRYIPGNVLILAPLAVSLQTVAEGRKFGVEVRYCRNQSEVLPGITITNYEMLDHFDASFFTGIVLDESSILKSFTGKIRNQIIELFQHTPFRLACTATPAPNDYMELGNHAEFLGVMNRTEMLAMYFIHDGSETSKWRLKGHGEEPFWKWICTWAMNVRKPSDLGYNDDSFTLPPMEIHSHVVKVGQAPEGFLFPVEALTLSERQAERRSTTSIRSEECAALVAEYPDDQWLIWCNLNDESAQLTAMIPGAVEVKGADSIEHKEKSLLGFADGTIRVMVSKPKIAGLGMNFQGCHKMAFVGLSDSYEQFYQAARRCWRFGQKHAVDIHVITAETEGAVVRNIQRKEEDAMRMAENMLEHMKTIEIDNIKPQQSGRIDYIEDVVKTDNYTIYNGDSCKIIKELADESIDMSVFSPPYLSLFTYSSSDRDMGNSRTDDEFYDHFRFLVEELYRVTKPGRHVAVDCMNVPAMKERDGYIGLKDFRGALIREFTEKGFIFHSEHCMWKDPLLEATRTKALGLMHKQLCKDSAMARAGIPQYLLSFRKPGVNDKPIAHPDGLEYFAGENPPVGGNPSHERWRRYASPVWMDINFNRTLNYRAARENNDERHICPMSLDITERALWLWSNPGDTIFSPFAGIGSELYQALQMGRKAIGIELKKSYFNQAVINCKEADATTAKQAGLYFLETA